MSDFNELLALLKKHVALFEELTAVEQKKLEAAQNYDVPVLEECMKKEQANTLVLRGYDKKRTQLLEALSFKDMTFRQIIPLLPKEYSYEFTQAFSQLNDAYSLYQSTSNCAKQVIEVNIYRLGNAISNIKNNTNRSTADVYTPEGSVETDRFTFRDMKI